MPRKPMKPCCHPGCPKLTEGRYCEEHEALHRGERKSASGRGYNSKWQRARKRFLKEHPLCCKCEEEGKYVRATIVDHIKPHRGDPILFWDTLLAVRRGRLFQKQHPPRLHGIHRFHWQIRYQKRLREPVRLPARPITEAQILEVRHVH